MTSTDTTWIATAVEYFEENNDADAIVYVNAYAVSRHYGGPQEGGWWYNAGEPLASVPLSDRTRIRAEVARLEELFADQQWGNIYSVNGGVELRIAIEDQMAEVWPEERPYYC